MNDPFNRSTSLSLSRYARQIRYTPIGDQGQQLLMNARVVVVGLGALGCVIAQHLVRAGIGYIRLIDRDLVEWSNLQRQLLYTEYDAQHALPKAEAAARHLLAMNSTVVIEPHIADLTPLRAEELLSDVDLIVDGTDNFTARYLMNDFSVKHTIPWIYGGAVGSSGTSMTILPSDTACYQCLFPEVPAPGSSDTCETAGVISPIVDVIGSIQATEAIKILSNNTEALHRTYLQVDLWNHVWLPLDIQHAKRADCPTCGQRHFQHLQQEQLDSTTTSLCGRDSIQVTPGHAVRLDLKDLSNRLRAIGEIELNPYLMKLQFQDNILFVLFQDGRAIVQGTHDSAKARSIYAELLGI